MAVLVTGVAGFIGFHLADALMTRGERVVGIDNFNSYYDPALKSARVDALLGRHGANFTLHRLDFADETALEIALTNADFDRIVHLGAQAGVRYSLENPGAYVRSNLVGHVNILEMARRRDIAHLVYASSSSVYGENRKQPFSVEDRADHPVSLYAATKRADELMSESYAHLYRIPQTGLRFFTVYGPWGRPDMAVWLFTSAILEGRPIQVFNHGRMQRDFTFIDDIVAGVAACLDHPPADDHAIKPGGSRAPHRLYNIGNNRPEALGTLIDLIEAACDRPAIREFREMQPGDVPLTYADIDAITGDLGFAPRTSLADGIPRFVDWYRAYRSG
ncbi:MAG TPA: protein CapI [Sphingomonas bacterium]|jgi:UDP-glucuronate 4-epimerase|uniref:Protein CapI n=1 Tax=Sphingomonas bacterium TaxID=1895847 RepID=A0A3D0WAJ1_9SPHN|nr:protein CapI [Sphingomonas bacterium]